MKNITQSAIFLSIFLTLTFVNHQIVAAIVSECDSVNEELTSKFRFLGGWDANGKPEYLSPESDPISQALLNYVLDTLPEKISLPELTDIYFGDDVQLNTELSEASEVYLTMVHEGADWLNTLGFYTYDIDNPPATVYDIDSLVIVFPNVTEPDVVKPGDMVLLGEFPANTGIGYFLIAKGWVGDTVCLKSHMIFTDSRFNTFTSEQYRQHAILLNFEPEDKLLLGFEDIKRPGGDNDFNDAVFYVTAEPGAIDTTDIVKIPTATISGDTVLCDEDDPANLQVSLTGKGPWSIVYSNGSEQIEIKDISESEYTFQTILKDTLRLVSVKDKNNLTGIVDGKATVLVSHPGASFQDDQAICESESSEGVAINLSGQAPFTLTLKADDQEYIIDNIQGKKYVFNESFENSIEVISISDKYCDGEISGAASLVKADKPGLTVENNGVGCGEGVNSLLDMQLEGESPWVVTYVLNNKEYNQEIQTSEYQLEISGTGTLKFTQIEDLNCVSELSITVEIVEKTLPTASLDGHSAICGNEAGTVDIELGGEGPWLVHYTFEGEPMTAESEEESLSLPISAPGLFQLTGVEDANCENSAEGSINFEFHKIPTVTLNENLTEVSEGIVTAVLDLKGTAPFSLTFDIDGQEKTYSGIMENQFVLNTSFNEYIELVAFSDKFCDGELGGNLVISNVNLPSLLVSEVGVICGDGVALIDIKLGGEGPWTVSYTLNGVEYEFQTASNSYQMEVAEAGTIVFVSVANGMYEEALSESVEIIKKELPSAEIINHQYACGDDHGTAEIGLTGEGPWTIFYTMNGSEISMQSNENPLVMDISQSGVFELIGVNDAFCENTADGEFIQEITDKPTATIGEDASICLDEEATINIDLTGEAPFTFIYTDGEAEVSVTTNENKYEFNTSVAKTYTLVSVEDANCTGDVVGSATITDGTENIEDEIMAEDNACFGEDIDLALSGELDGYTITWSTDGNGTLENTNQANTKYIPADSESGEITMNAEIQNHCAALTLSKTITIIDEVDASFDVSPSNNLLTESQITFTPSNNSYDEYYWDFDDGNTSTATISSNEYAEGGIYTINLTVNIAGCEGTESMEIEVYAKDELYVPNAFNPNAENPENQVVKVYGKNVDEAQFTFMIVNRWGKVMYKTNSFNEANTVGWGGVNRNTNEEMELNVFTYLLRGRFAEGESFERTGTITQVK